MRVGQNPAKNIDHVPQPQRVTVAVVSYIPFLEGYYQESLEVLKTCLGSIWENTDLPYDLLVFDNASCPEARAFLLEAQEAGRIQYLVLSDKNVGKGGAWNFIFSAAPGEIIAYADSDIYFFPGWLSPLVEVLDKVPNVGMVTGMPMWSPAEFSTGTVQWAEAHPEARLETGQFLPWQDFWRHSRSLGASEEKARAQFDARQDMRLHYQGAQFYVGAGHFQFAARRAVLQSILPLPSQRPMGQVRSLDIALNERGYLRLAMPNWWVQHMGNTLQGQNLPGLSLTRGPAPDQQPAAPQSKKKVVGFWSLKPARRFLTWVYGKAFDILYRG